MRATGKTRISDEQLAEKLPAALEAVKALHGRSYAPYSNFFVSAILYLQDQDCMVEGVNIENISYGATICAERSAFSSAISRFGKIRPGFLVLYTEHDPLTTPCGICRQFMSEFVGPDFPIILTNHLGMRRDMVFSDFLPNPFDEF